MPASESQISFPDPFYTDPTFLNALLAILNPFVTEAEVSKCKIYIDNCFKSRNGGYSAMLLAKLRLFVLGREAGVALSPADAKELLVSYFAEKDLGRSGIGSRRVSTASTSSESHSDGAS